MPPWDPLTAMQPASDTPSWVIESTSLTVRIGVREVDEKSRPGAACACSIRAGSVGVNAGCLDDGAPLGDLAGHELLVLGPLAALVVHHHGAQAFLLLAGLGLSQCYFQFIVGLFR